MRKTTAQPEGAKIGRVPKLNAFGAKANRFLCNRVEKDARLNILVGSVRSAKTWAMMIKILALCRYKVAGHKVLTGVTKQAIYQNVLNDLFEIVGESNYNYNRQTGELMLCGSKWLVVGAHDEGSEKAIRGMTVGVAVCDELVLMPRGFFMMLLSRMSPENARLYATTNPDTPWHWLKTEVLDSTTLQHGLGKDIWSETWTLEDNINLDENFKAFIRRKYTGVFYSRFVLGQWVVASGAIYRDVLSEAIYYDDTTRPVGLLSRGGHVERWVAIDVGTVNAFAALDVYDDGTTLWIEREMYWDSKAEGRQKTNTEYAADLLAWFGPNQRDWPGVVIDPSAASFRVELVSRGIYVTDADNEVLEGIRKVAAMFARGKLRIHRRCVNLRSELESYSWDEKRADNGKEQPIKSHDHGVDACRYLVATRINDWRIAV